MITVQPPKESSYSEYDTQMNTDPGRQEVIRNQFGTRTKFAGNKESKDPNLVELLDYLSRAQEVVRFSEEEFKNKLGDYFTGPAYDSLREWIASGYTVKQIWAQFVMDFDNQKSDSQARQDLLDIKNMKFANTAKLIQYIQKHARLASYRWMPGEQRKHAYEVYAIHALETYLPEEVFANIQATVNMLRGNTRDEVWFSGYCKILSNYRAPLDKLLAVEKKKSSNKVKKVEEQKAKAAEKAEKAEKAKKEAEKKEKKKEKQEAKKVTEDKQKANAQGNNTQASQNTQKQQTQAQNSPQQQNHTHQCDSGNQSWRGGRGGFRGGRGGGRGGYRPDGGYGGYHGYQPNPYGYQQHQAPRFNLPPPAPTNVPAITHQAEAKITSINTVMTPPCMICPGTDHPTVECYNFPVNERISVPDKCTLCDWKRHHKEIFCPVSTGRCVNLAGNPGPKA